MVGKTKKKRDVSYELIRVIAMLFIIFDHNLNPFFNDAEITKYLEPFFVVGVTLFFMLSGKFAFRLNLEDKSLYKKFYWKKVIGLIIPMLVYMAIKNWHVMWYNQGLTVTPRSYLEHFGIAFLNGFSYMEYWFLYLLIALFVAVPFTAHMMQSFKEKDKKAFLIVGGIMSTLSTFIPILFKVPFAIEYNFIGYALFFYLGYIIEDIFKANSAKKRLYITGLLGFVATLIMIKIGKVDGYKSTSPFYLLFTIASFVGLHELGKKISEKFERIIFLFGKHSLGVYMIHMMFLYAINDLKFFPEGIIGYIGSTITIIVISLCASFILDNTIIKWLQKATIKIFRLENVIK